jgi:predicted TPR repeat methyltransferase
VGAEKTIMIQKINELEKWHEKKDPWQYEKTKDDLLRKEILLSELPKHDFACVLDIGCGQGFVTKDLPGEKIIGVDISSQAIKHAKQHENDRIKFAKASIFELNEILPERYNLIVITGVLYRHYIGNSLRLIYLIIDELLQENGILASVHINTWYMAKFPYLLISDCYYEYRDYIHKLEIYTK